MPHRFRAERRVFDGAIVSFSLLTGFQRVDKHWDRLLRERLKAKDFQAWERYRLPQLYDWPDEAESDPHRRSFLLSRLHRVSTLPFWSERLFSSLRAKTPIRLKAVSFLHRLLDEGMRVIVYSPHVLGMSVVIPAVRAAINVPGWKRGWRQQVDFVVNGWQPTGTATELVTDFPPGKRVRHLLFSGYTSREKWCIATEDPLEAAVWQQLVPHCRIIGVCDPGDYESLELWDHVPAIVTNRGECFQPVYWSN